MPKLGSPKEDFISEGGAAYRQANVDPFPRNGLNKKHEDPFDLT